MFSLRTTRLAFLSLCLFAACRVRDDRPTRRDCPDGRCPAQDHTLRSAFRTGGEHPVMNLPPAARCRNYAGGSCVIASTISLLRWQGLDELAERFRRLYSGGQSADSLHAKLDAHALRYACTTRGDVRFLEWAIRTRRGAGITFYPMHFVNLVDLTPTHAVLLDNNRVERYITLPRREFEQRWRAYGGWATTVVYAPAPPVAKR
ncbi:MAG TPA: hypothetical protein VFW87_07800 [Pirellulales bacterium]|nr:hypothetical protein [Pirellulales bacterium]